MGNNNELIDFLKNLAQGINPVTGEKIENNPLIEDVIFVRKIYYLIDQIEQKTVKEKHNKIINKDVFNSIVLPIEPIHISGFIDYLSENYNLKIVRKKLSNWLINQNIIVTTENGKKQVSPTGTQIGVSTITKRGRFGIPLDVIVYNEHALRFILDNYVLFEHVY